jgi:hypothetical protein
MTGKAYHVLQATLDQWEGIVCVYRRRCQEVEGARQSQSAVDLSNEPPEIRTLREHKPILLYTDLHFLALGVALVCDGDVPISLMESTTSNHLRRHLIIEQCGLACQARLTSSFLLPSFTASGTAGQQP